MDKKEIFNSIFVGAGTFFTYAFGLWDTVLIALVSFMAVDYITGTIAGAINKELNSNKGFNGLLRKFTILLVIILAVLLDRLLSNGTWVFRTAVAYFYIANEGLSIVENVAKCGVPFPEKILNILEQLKNKEIKKEGESIENKRI
ncbi:phage holin family protein [uncultured Clostridium sp.]|uniref:phage holin family protein n=1 Tax=uncultured Clostridium sp. TaxID=59620 RepID=UPI0028E68F5B|nr:phage holin family protein [uncultured Clostridium sp.]